NSPGFSAKYSTYSLMDDASDKIVHFELVQVSLYETIGLKRGLTKILENGIKVDVLTTDRSPSIRKIMRVDYPFIQHEFDIWHVAKGLLKKLLSLSRYKDIRDLHPWIKCICNHLWYSCSSCGGDPDVKHSWTQDGMQHRCLHSDLSPEQQRRKRWINNDSHAYHTLETIVLNKGLLNDLSQMALFNPTEVVHFHFSSMLARTQLAILDHNENVQRKQATTRPVITCDTSQSACKYCFKDRSSHVTLSSLPANIATKPKPDKQEAILKHQSRFSH
uniref:Uncharacterized protein n=1 Tax=Sinocyclocheilus anshuiensis TaxID=1608454 RepID=A0A671R2S6_9TELE